MGCNSPMCANNRGLGGWGLGDGSEIGFHGLIAVQMNAPKSQHFFRPVAHSCHGIIAVPGLKSVTERDAHLR